MIFQLSVFPERDRRRERETDSAHKVETRKDQIWFKKGRILTKEWYWLTHESTIFDFKRDDIWLKDDNWLKKGRYLTPERTTFDSKKDDIWLKKGQYLS